MLKFRRNLIISVILVAVLAACTTAPAPTPEEPVVDLTVQALVEAITSATPTPSPTPPPPSVLTVCMGQEPTSLFLYADTTAAARGVRQAIYDGPIDRVGGQLQPVILERIPSLENGDAELRPVEVARGDVIIDADGNWVALSEETRYRPSGCTSAACAQTYTGDQPVTLDALVVRFHLLPGLLWSDGTPLTAQDSVYSFQVAQAFYGNTLDTLRYTHSYTALDEQTVEWVAIPGYQSAYAENFFSPLPQHLLGSMELQTMLTAELAARTPLGWGPYAIQEWVPGDHLTLQRNPNYFRAGEGLPRFDNLVFRFVEPGSAAVDALLIGECDFVDQTALSLDLAPRLLEAQADGQIQLHIENNSAWEQAAFGIASLDEEQHGFFVDQEVRQAIAMCIDRQMLVDEQLHGWGVVADGYLPPGDARRPADLPAYDYNPEAARTLLASVGWVDADQDTSTPLTALGRTDVADGTPLTFDYWVPADSQSQAAANFVQASLETCGIHITVKPQPWEQFLQPGPEGDVFGRRFAMAQFAWSVERSSMCTLFSSAEIPGPASDFAKGWGGGNITGYRNPDFDAACRTAQTTLPDIPENLQAAQQAQSLFAQDLPAVPLYWNPEIAAAQAALCLLPGAPDVLPNLLYLEQFASGDDCAP